MLDVRSDKMYDYFHVIDKISTGHFQRRLKRCWTRFRDKKEQKRLKKEAEKGKRRGFRKGSVKK